MSVNSYLHHLQVLPEDDANRQFMNGVALHPRVNPRRLQVLPPAGGWMAVLDQLSNTGVIRGLEKYSQRHLLLLIDFDNTFEQRRQYYEKQRAALPTAVAARVYLLGCLDEPESFRSTCTPYRSLEQLGQALAEECEPAQAGSLWQDAQLRHNAGEIERLVAHVQPFLFQTALA